MLTALHRNLTLFWKIQVANTALLLCAVIGSLAFRNASAAAVPIVAALAVIVTALLNSVIVRAALLPLQRLRSSLGGIHGEPGDMPLHASGDPLAASIGDALDAMLDRLNEAKRSTERMRFEAERRERSRLAHDLHDDISQRVAQLTVALDALGRQTDGALKSSLHDLAAMAKEIALRLRRTMMALHPLVLDDLGFFAALRWLLEEEVPDLEHHVALEGPEPEGELAAILFRIAQEAISNVRRHAKARGVWLRTCVQDDCQVLELEDDGRGFVPKTLDRPGYGLRSMRERARGLHGTLGVWGEPLKGAGLRVTIPITKEPS